MAKSRDIRREVAVANFSTLITAVNNSGGSSGYGDNAIVATVSLTDVSSTVVLANVNRKETWILNTTGKTLWLYYGTPAVFGKGIQMLKSDIIIEDKYRGIITAIMDTGQVGDIEVTDVIV